MQLELKGAPSTASGMYQVTVISLGLFVIFLDSTIVNIALPTMIEQFAISLKTAAWVMNAYTMTVAILLIFMGKLADLYGKKRLFSLGLILFMVSSLLCAFAPNASLLIAARTLQGISGAMAIPASMSLVRSIVPKEKVGAAMGIWSAVGALAIAIGPSLGGLITGALGWQWVFYMNVPVVLFALFLQRNALKSYQDHLLPGKLDWWGTLLLSLGLFCFINGFLQVTDSGWLSQGVMWQIAIAVITMCGFVWIQSKRANPLLDLTIFSNRQYLAGLLSNTLGGLLLMGTMMISPLFLTRIFHFSTLKASILMTPLSVSLLLIAPFIGKLIDKIGSRIPLTIGYGITILSFLLLGTVHLQSSIRMFVVSLALAGIGIGILAIASLTLSTISIPEEQLNIASGTFAMFRNLGGALGIALFVSVTLGITAESTGTTEAFRPEAFQHAYLSGAVLAIGFMFSLLLLSKKNETVTQN
ncbi:MFS transporter [Paenibacillus sp. CGMCC 1.16610]|uniref:DHA2 family efflux MFS transporter permease subunit n=1 Tax=Paenibacillus anseongense TaxID=2682845 RepID=A0ABW9UFH7_9BACL|nr:MULTISPECIES: MFS transporter [Paenibacillus]MBA2943887.1 MFS transporter [Paenibacillus sp. CGMCC 1.16610]MVQ37776.1 DHA2 family efflux MFS transporter permease subunit [Paenibacillus anseongense]